MYCDTVFYRNDIYVSVSSSPANLIAYPKRGYSHVPSVCRQGIFPKILHATLWRNPPRIRLMRGVGTQISDPNSRMAWITAT